MDISVSRFVATEQGVGADTGERGVFEPSHDDSCLASAVLAVWRAAQLGRANSTPTTAHSTTILARSHPATRGTWERERPGSR